MRFSPTALARSATDRQILLTIEALNPLVVDDNPFSAQQHMKSAVAEARSSRRQFPQAGTHHRRLVRPDPISG
jgi:hypothetical protein